MFSKYFPHEKVRSGQSELIEDLNSTLAAGKILIAHAPTGLGKTASALSEALEVAGKRKIFFLTNRHTQHQIAVETLQLIKKKTGEEISCVDLIGKRWMCNQEISGLFGNDFNEFCKSLVEKGECEFYSNVKTKNGLTVPAEHLVSQLKNEGPMFTEQLAVRSQEKRMCSYEVSLALAKQAQVIIGDYNYIFNPFVQGTLFAKLGIELEDCVVIVDEGHNLPSRVQDMMSSNLTTTMIKNSLNEAKKFRYDGLITWLEQLHKIINDLSVNLKNEKLITQDQFSKRVEMIVPYDLLIEQLEDAADEIRKKQRRSYIGGVASFLTAWDGSSDGYARILSERSTPVGRMHTLSYTCLDPSIITKDIFARIACGVVMSGTLLPTFMYKDLLGIKDAVVQQYPSPFPPENRLSLVVPETSTKFTLRNPNMYGRMAEICSDVANTIPGNVAFFFPSYHLRDEVCQMLKINKELFWEKKEMLKEEKEQLLELFKAAKVKGGVLLAVTGANFAEGIDFPGDLLQGVVVVGIPLARPDLKTQETIKYYDGKFGKGWDYGYTFPAMNKCNQSAGRCIRSETDRGVIIYLDERFAWQKYYSCLPREGLIVSKEYNKFLGEFF